MKQKTHLIPNTFHSSNQPDPPMTTIVPFTDIITSNGTYSKTASANTAFSPINITVNVPTQAQTAFNVDEIRVLKRANSSSTFQFGTWQIDENVTNNTYISIPGNGCLILMSSPSYSQIKFLFFKNTSAQSTRYYPNNLVSETPIYYILFTVTENMTQIAYFNPEIQFLNNGDFLFSLDGDPSAITANNRIFSFNPTNLPTIGTD